MVKPDLLFEEAAHFIRQCYQELGCEEAIEPRLAEIASLIEATGTYCHTFAELEYGARVAWRNSNRCIGRLFWETLHVFDERALEDAQSIAAALLRHIGWATNNGRIRPAVTILAPEKVRVWNYQLLRYAGYETAGGIVGDPDSVAFTEVCLELGWRGAGTPYDLLPLVIQVEGGPLQWFELPGELVLEVPIRHPDSAAFNDLGIRWYAVPIVSDMLLEIGGIRYTAAPFNGWYMGTEIGARNLADASRYNLLPAVAQALGLDTRHASTLWKDRALVELNAAVLASFREYGATIVDHHTAAQQFKRFEEKEQATGREATGRWSWLIPPLSPAATHVFHRAYNDEERKPLFAYQPRLYGEGHSKSSS